MHALSFVPKPFHGAVTLFRCMEQDADPAFEILDDDLGWSRLALDGVDVVRVPGKHLSILTEPDVDSLAQLMRHAAGREYQFILEPVFSGQTRHQKVAHV